MKVIFLDIDGVVLPFNNINRITMDLDNIQQEMAEKFDDEGFYELTKSDIGAAAYDFEPEAIDNLKKLIKKTGAKIVFSTGWRYMGYEHLRKLFKVVGLEDDIVGETPYFETIDNLDDFSDIEKPISFFKFGYSRVIEILEYNRTHDVENFVALDDMDLHQLGRHYIAIGNGYFDKNNYKEALKVLKD